MLESIEKLRESLRDCTSEAGVEPNQFDTYWITAKACDILIDEIEREIADRYIPLPVDADGVPIHMGDRVKPEIYEDGRVESIEIRGSGAVWIGVIPDGWDTQTVYRADNVRHYKPRTVEDVLREMVGMTDQPLCEEDIQAFAAEIRDLLGGDAE